MLPLASFPLYFASHSFMKLIPIHHSFRALFDSSTYHLRLAGRYPYSRTLPVSIRYSCSSDPTHRTPATRHPELQDDQ